MITPDIMARLKQAESAGNPNAMSPKGAAGAFQIMPATAATPGYGVQPLQNWDNVDPRTASSQEQERFATDYLQAMAALNGGDVRLALAAYNAGPGAVQAAGGVPNFKETQDYVNKIIPQGQEAIMASNQVQAPEASWRSRAQAVQQDAPSATPKASPSSDWRSRAQAAQPEAATQPVSTAGDVTKTIASNVVKGGVDAAMILPNLLNEAAAGPQYLYQGIKDTVQGNPTNKDFQPYKPFFSSEDVTSGSAVDYQPQTTAGKVSEIPARLLSNIVAPTAINKVGNSKAVSNFLSNQSSVRTPKPVLKTGAELKTAAGESYDLAKQLGSTYTAKQVAQPFNKALVELRPKPIAGKVLTSEEQKLTSHLNEYTSLKTSDLTFDEVRRLDQGLTAKINANFIDARTGQPDDSGRKLMILQTKLRESLDDIPDNAANDALRNANKLWKGQIIVGDLETVAERALMTQNPAQAMRTGYKNLYFDKDRIRGWPPEAVKLLKKAGTPGMTDEALSFVSSRLTAIILGGTGNIGGAAGAAMAGVAGRGVRANMAARAGGKVQQAVVDNALNNLRPVKVPTKSTETLLLASPDKMSRLPMTDTQVNIAQKLGAVKPAQGVDASGSAIKPPRKSGG